MSSFEKRLTGVSLKTIETSNILFIDNENDKLNKQMLIDIDDDDVFKEFNFTQNEKLNLLLSYIFVAYLWTWGLGWPAVSLQYSDKDFFKNYKWIILGIAAFGPTISAFVVMYIFRGKDGMMNLIRRCYPRTIPNKSLVLFSFFSMPLLLSFCFACYYMFGGSNLPKIKTPLGFIITFVLSFPVGSMGEEFGWRGINIIHLYKYMI